MAKRHKNNQHTNNKEDKNPFARPCASLLLAPTVTVLLLMSKHKASEESNLPVHKRYKAQAPCVCQAKMSPLPGMVYRASLQ